MNVGSFGLRFGAFRVAAYSRGRKHTFEGQLRARLERGSDLEGTVGALSDRKCADED